jgi:hypothetical protein
MRQLFPWGLRILGAVVFLLGLAMVLENATLGSFSVAVGAVTMLNGSLVERAWLKAAKQPLETSVA